MSPMFDPPDRRARSRWYRVVMLPKTLYLFWKFFRLAGEPRPIREAVRFSFKTL